MEKLNKKWVGFLLCFLCPLLLFVCTWQGLSKQPLYEVGLWLKQPVFLQYTIFCTLPDLVILYMAYHTESWKICQGGILGLLPYLMLLFYLFC